MYAFKITEEKQEEIVCTLLGKEVTDRGRVEKLNGNKGCLVAWRCYGNFITWFRLYSTGKDKSKVLNVK